MNRLLMSLLLLLLLTVSAGGRYLLALYGKQALLQQTNVQLSTGIGQRDTTIRQLQEAIARQAEAERTLRQSLLRAGDIAMRKQLNDQRIIRSNETLQHWNDAALPDGIIRLQQHPAFTTPDDYLAWLSDGQQLFDPGHSAANTGRSPDRHPPTGAGATDVRPASRNP